MTFQASLTANKPVRHSHPWACSFRQALRETLLPVILNTLLFVVVIALTNLFSLITRNGMNQAEYLNYKYCLFSGSMIHITFSILAWATALLQGLLIFRMLFSRNAAHAWFGLGLSRRQLFWSRYAAGAVGVLLPLVAAMLTTLAVNLTLFADVGLVLARFSFFLLGMGLQVLVLYSIVVLVCCAAKTVVEGIVFSVILTLLPSMLLLTMNGLMVHLLPGNGYINADSFYYTWNTELVHSLSDWNPLLFMNPYLQYFGGQSAAQSDVSYLSSIGQMPLLSIHWLLIPGWLAVTGALAWAARHVFLRTKVENTGVLGAGRAMDYAGILALGFFAFSLVFMLPYNVTQKLSLGAMLGIGAAAAIVVMLAMAFPLRLLRHRFWKGLLLLGAGLVAILAVCGMLAVGGLGYSSFVPKTDDVKSVTMSYNGIDLYVPWSGGGGSGGLVQEITCNNDVTFTTKADMAAVMGVHRALIQAGVPAGPTRDATGKRNLYDVFTKITYTMNDGSTVTRGYVRLTPDLMKKMMVLDNTDAVKQAYRDYLSREGPKKYWTSEAYLTGDVYLCAPFMGATQQLSLDENQHKKLLRCIVEDLTAQTPEDRYLPQQPETCILAFAPQGASLNASDLFESGHVYVTKQFVQTLAFLTENNWMGSIATPADIESIAVMDYSGTDHNYDYNMMYSIPIFFSGTGSQAEADSLQRNKKYPVLKLEDNARQQEVLSRSHAVYFTGDEGYLVLIKYKGQDRVVSAFLPAKDAPDFVVQGTK